MIQFKHEMVIIGTFDKSVKSMEMRNVMINVLLLSLFWQKN